MKHSFALSMLFTILTVAICSGTILNVEQCYQEQDQWCWAGCSETILEYHGVDITQTEIAAYGTEGLNEWNWLYNSSSNPTRRGMNMILDHFASLVTAYGNYVLSQTEVQYINDNLWLLVVRWGWDSGGGHFVVGHGIEDDTMYLMDPWNGPTVNSYNWVVKGSSHTWTHTLEVVTQASRPDLLVQSITVDPGYAWRPSTITAVIMNNGSETAQFGSLDRICRFEIDGQVEYDTALSPVSIPPGGTYSSDVTCIISGVGSYPVVAVLDPDDAVIESIEGNNSRTESRLWTASAIHDTDGDGMIDADEVLAGSEPNNGSNVWQCACVITTNGGYQITWPSVSGRWYAVERAVDLKTGFSVIASDLPATPPENSYLDTTTTTNAFYRIEVRP